MSAITQGADVQTYKKVSLDANLKLYYPQDVSTNNKIWNNAIAQTMQINLDPAV